MKKILLLFILLIVACSSVSQYDTEFKNPVFNQPLEPLSSGAGYVYLTPKSVDFRTPLDKNKIDTQGKCDLHLDIITITLSNQHIMEIKKQF